MKKWISRLIAAIVCLYCIPTTVFATDMLIPVGRVVGLELQNNTVSVADFEEGSAAQAAGLEIGDRLISLDDHPIRNAQDVRNALDRSQGSIRITVQRGTQLQTIRVEPAITADGPKLGHPGWRLRSADRWRAVPLCSVGKGHLRVVHREEAPLLIEKIIPTGIASGDFFV